MSSRVPAARWVATITVVAVLMVLTALAVRMKLGNDPAIGAVSASTDSTTTTSETTTDSGVQDLFDDGSSSDDSSSSSGSSSAVPSSPSTSQAS